MKNNIDRGTGRQSPGTTKSFLLSLRQRLRAITKFARLILLVHLFSWIGGAQEGLAQIAFRAASTGTVVSAGPVLMSDSFVDGQGSTTTLPVGWQPGDLHLCSIQTLDSVPVTMSTGWSLLNRGISPGGQYQAATFWKIAGQGDSAPTITHGNANLMWMMTSVRNVSQDNPFESSTSFTYSNADATTEADAITTTTPNALLIFMSQNAGPYDGGSGAAGPYTITSGSSPLVPGVTWWDSTGLTAFWSGWRPEPGNQAAIVLTHPNKVVESYGSQMAIRPAGIANVNIAKPPGTQTNDVLIASIAFSPSTASISTPAGWTLVRRIDHDYTEPRTVSSSKANSLAIYVKSVGASEPGQYTWTVWGAYSAAGGVQAFSGVDISNPINGENGVNTADSLSHSTPGMTTTVPNTMLVASFGFSSSATWTPASGLSEGFDISSISPPNAIGVSAEGNYALQAAAGATPVFTATASGNSDVGNAHILALRPSTAQSNTNVYFIHTDHLNTPRLVTNGSGQVVWRWDNTDPFGYNVPNENPSGGGPFTCNLRFPGQYFDKETNLHYNMARDYDPAIGRYIQPEPLGLAGDINLYQYARNNPLTFFDPDGEQATSVLSGPAAGALPGRAAASAGSRAIGALGPVGAVAGAGLAGYQVGSAIYPFVALPLARAIDYCIPMSNMEECKKRCDDAYYTQIETICKKITTRTGRRQCYENATSLYSDCLANCR